MLNGLLPEPHSRPARTILESQASSFPNDGRDLRQLQRDTVADTAALVSRSYKVCMNRWQEARSQQSQSVVNN